MLVETQCVSCRVTWEDQAITEEGAGVSADDPVGPDGWDEVVMSDCQSRSTSEPCDSSGGEDDDYGDTYPSPPPHPPLQFRPQCPPHPPPHPDRSTVILLMLIQSSCTFRDLAWLQS